MKNHISDNKINYDTMHQHDKKTCSKKCTEPQSEITAKLSEPELSGAHLNSVSSCHKPFVNKKGRL